MCAGQGCLLFNLRNCSLHTPCAVCLQKAFWVGWIWQGDCKNRPSLAYLQWARVRTFSKSHGRNGYGTGVLWFDRHWSSWTFEGWCWNMEPGRSKAIQVFWLVWQIQALRQILEISKPGFHTMANSTCGSRSCHCWGCSHGRGWWEPRSKQGRNASGKTWAGSGEGFEINATVQAYSRHCGRCSEGFMREEVFQHDFLLPSTICNWVPKSAPKIARLWEWSRSTKTLASGMGQPLLGSRTLEHLGHFGKQRRHGSISPFHPSGW